MLFPQIVCCYESQLTMEPTTTPKPFVFVVMPFTKEFDDTYKLGIKPACVEAGTYCERLDEQIFEEGMLDRIYNQIAKADIVVADMSGHNANVFYEVGYAHALGKRVILVTREANDIPFDLKHRFHIVYDGSISKLKDKLFERVAWFVAHPEDRKATTGESAQFYIRGEPLVQGKDYRVRFSHLSKGNRVFLADLAVHNSDGANTNELVFTPALITSDEFEACENPDGTISASSFILPDGRRLHQYDGAIGVQPSGWQKVPFGLTSRKGTYGTQFPVTLRILGDGPPREVEFSIQLVNSSGENPPIRLV